MDEIKRLKCNCCLEYDTFDGCRADWGCYFVPSIEKLKATAQENNMSVSDLIAFMRVNEKTW